MRSAGALLVVVALALSGCETNEQRSARLAHAARLAHSAAPAQTGLHVTHQSPFVKVLATTVLHDANGVAAVVTLRSDARRALREVPVAIALRDAAGAATYQNDLPGLSAPLTHAPLLLPGRPFMWIDDQIPTSGAPGKLSARIGEAAGTSAHPPVIAITGAHLVDDPTSGVAAEGTVVNRSAIAQEELVVFAVAKRPGRIVAAGRAVLPEVPAHSSTPFQVFFIGDPRGASLSLSAPPTTLR